MNNPILEDWLVEFDIPAAGGQPDPFGMTPTTDPMGGPMGGMTPGDPNITNQPQDMAPPLEPEQDDLTQDPQTPNMPEESPKMDDFEIWKANFFKESIKGEPDDLLDFMSTVREQETLQPYQRKFVEDNWNIQVVRRNSNILKASKEIRKLLKEQLDHNNPATSVVNHMSQVLETTPMLNNKFIQILGYGAHKGELHRKFIAALTGAVQVSSGHDKANIIFNENEYAIKMLTRFNAEWGNIPLGAWSLREDDPERYLSEPELRRLQEGSPEEKDVLRRRIVVEALAKQHEHHAFIMHNVADDGTIYCVGWDLANSLRGAYVEGKLVVKTRHSDQSEAMIDDNGAIIPLIDLNIFYVKETGQQDEEGLPEKEEMAFMERKHGMMFLTAGMQTLRESAAAMQGMVFKEIPYQGNPSDLMMLRRCTFSTYDLLMKEC